MRIQVFKISSRKKHIKVDIDIPDWQKYLTS
nr:MAG TPA: hypothetical protein [Caudoviricetes sp.]